MARSIEEITKEQKKLLEPQMNEDIKTSDNNYEGQKNITTDTYNKQIDDTAKSYNDLYDINAVQKLINEREVAENMADLGLTDSGLNRTQQTATQLSYANNRNKIDLQRQKSVDTLTSALADKISEIDIQKLNASASIRSNYNNQIVSNANSVYKSELDYDTKMYSEQLKAIKKQQQADKKANYMISANDATIRTDYMGSLKDNGVTVKYEYDEYGEKTKAKYVDTRSGKSITVAANVNPHTGTVNPDVYNGVWKNGNGYQPDNIGGYKLEAVDWTGEGAVNGNTQRVFKLIKGHNNEYYVWDGRTNAYFQVVKQNGQWVAK